VDYYSPTIHPVSIQKEWNLIGTGYSDECKPYHYVSSQDVWIGYTAHCKTTVGLMTVHHSQKLNFISIPSYFYRRVGIYQLNVNHPYIQSIQVCIHKDKNNHPFHVMIHNNIHPVITHSYVTPVPTIKTQSFIKESPSTIIKNINVVKSTLRPTRPFHTRPSLRPTRPFHTRPSLRPTRPFHTRPSLRPTRPFHKYNRQVRTFRTHVIPNHTIQTDQMNRNRLNQLTWYYKKAMKYKKEKRYVFYKL
jgi:hypothetical protein